MGDKTKIEWSDATWGPVTGCTKVSPGCDHCYAETLAERFRGTPGHYFEHGFDVQLRPDKLDLPLRWKRPRRIFVNSMSDLFHDAVPDEYVARVFAVMALAQHHTFQVLTKRHGRMRSLLSRPDFNDLVAREVMDLLPTVRDRRIRDRVAGAERAWQPLYRWPLPNVWLGVSVENQQWADIRIPALLRTPAAVRFLSCEPLLGPVALHRYLPNGRGEGARHNPRPSALANPLPTVDWVIVGGESGRDARPMHPGWARAIRDECQASGVPFLFKQFGEWQDGSAAPDQRGEDHIILWDGRHEPAVDHWAENDKGWWTSPLIKDRNARRRGVEPAVFISRVGKKAAGRELDGRTWDEYPEV